MRAIVRHPCPGLPAGATVNLTDAGVTDDAGVRIGTILDVVALDDELELTVDFTGWNLSLPATIVEGRHGS